MTYDQGKRGDGTRVNMLHCLFSHKDPQPCTNPKKPLHPDALVTWKSTWTGKSHEFAGNFTRSDHILKFFRTRVFGELEGGVAVTDNAGTHRKLVQQLKELSDVDLRALIVEKCEDVRKDSYRGWVWSEFEKWENDEFPQALLAGPLRKFIRKHHLADTELGMLADSMLVQLVFLPQYHPEANPIERYWALLKRLYYDTDPKQEHGIRLRKALALIPPEFPQRCIQKSLAWCWAKHREMKATKGAAVVAPVEVGDLDLQEDLAGLPDACSSSSSASSASSDSDSDEE